MSEGSISLAIVSRKGGRARNQLGSLFRMSFLANQIRREKTRKVDIILNWFREMEQLSPVE